MISLLTQIVNQITCWIETAGIFIANAVITSAAAAITAIVALLPSFPSVTMPTELQNSLAFGEYIFPLDWLVSEVVVFVTLALTWFALSIALRWLRAVRGNQ